LAITTALTLRTLFRLGLRQTEGLIGSVIDLLGLDLAIPDHSTLSRRAATLPVVQLPSGASRVHLLIDSTGLKLCGAGEWLVEKHGSTRRRSWRKLHIGMDADTAQILAALLTPKEVDDASEVGTLLDRADDPIAAVIADGAYDQDTVYADVAARHPAATVVVPPRATAVLGTNAKSAPTQRDRHLPVIATHGRMG
jgi:IS5 family transposase